MAESGKTFIQALHDKYEETEPLSCIIYVPKSAPGKTDSGELVLPRQLALNDSGVTSAGDPEEIAKLCKNVCELDLTDNSLQEWKEVFTILEQMPGVHFLNVSANPLKDSVIPDTVFEAITRVVLNSLELPWQTVWNLLKCVPKCQELHLSLNKYSCVSLPDTDQTFPNITHLLFNGNAVSDWAEISKLGQALPNLEVLVMMENPLVSLPEAGVVGKDFNKLKSINITKTQIKDWGELEKFRHFETLSEIRLKEIAFLEKYSEKQRRHLVIGYLPNMVRINGSKVGEEERQDAERAFIRHYMDEEEKPARYFELEAIHGKLDKLANVNLVPPEKISMTVKTYEKRFLHEFNPSWTVAQMKEKLSKVLELQPAKFHVYYSDQCLPGATAMKDLKKTLYNFRVKEGDEFHIQLVDNPKPMGDRSYRARRLRNDDETPVDPNKYQNETY